MENNYFIHLLPAVTPAQGKNYLFLRKYVLILSLLSGSSSNSCELCSVQTLNNNNGEHVWRAHVKLLGQKSYIFHPANGWQEKELPNFTPGPLAQWLKPSSVEKIPELFQDSLWTKESKIANLGISMEWFTHLLQHFGLQIVQLASMQCFPTQRLANFHRKFNFLHPVLWISKWQ